MKQKWGHLINDQDRAELRRIDAEKKVVDETHRIAVLDLRRQRNAVMSRVRMRGNRDVARKASK